MRVPDEALSDGIRVLYVADDHGGAGETATGLEREAGVEVERARSASDGLDRLDDDVDCVVSAYEMSGRDGVELLHAVRESHPAVPFVLFTDAGSEAVASDAISAGATDYVRRGSEGIRALADRVQEAVEEYRSERTRRRNERRFEAVFEDPKMHVAILDLDGTVLQVNRTALDAVGADREAVVGERFPETPWWSHSEDLQADLREWIERAASGEYVEFERDHPRQDGDTYTVEGTVRPVTDGTGEVTSLVASARDVTARTERERTVKRERDRRSALFENAPGPVIAGEIRDGGERHLVSDVNEAFEDVFAFDREAVVGRDVADVVVPEGDRAAHQEFRDRAAAGETVEANVERITADGPREFILTVIPYGTGDGSADGWYAWYTDVTERAERTRRIEALHTATRRLTAAETEQEVAEMTVQAAEDTLGFPRNVVRLRDDGDLLVPVALSSKMEAKFESDRPAYEVGEETAGLAFAKGETLVYDDVGDLDDGVERTDGPGIYVPIGEYGVLTVSGTGPDAFGGTDLDLAEILAAHAAVALERVERTRELQARNERLDEFASIVAHDLRNPLNVLSGSLDLAAETGDPDHLRRCSRAVTRMEGLIDDLLTVARQGEDVEDPDRVDLSAIVETAWNTVGTDGATLELHTDAAVRADRGRIVRLLENLLRNAVEHGGPTVAVTVGDLDRESGFYVEDDGPGIPEDRRGRVFESGHSTAAEGTGFGLAIVERIVEAHGWSIRATESETGGARFEITGVRME